MESFLLVDDSAIEAAGYRSLFNLIYILEMVFEVASAALVGLGALIVARTSEFHENLCRILCLLLSSYVVLGVPGRLVLLAVQVDIIHRPADFSKVQHMAVVQTASMVRTVFFHVVFFSLPGVVVERLAATLLIRDYERKRRYYISNSLMLTIGVFALIVSYIVHTNFSKGSAVPACISYTILVTSALVVYLYTIFVNSRLDRSLLTTAADRYTLSERFQVAENIKATRTLRIIMYPASCFAVVLATLFVTALTVVKDDVLWRNLCFACFDLGIVFFACVTMIMAGHSSAAWRNDARRLLRRLPVVGRFINVNRVEPPRELQFFGKVTLNPQSETAVYFENLKSLWA